MAKLFRKNSNLWSQSTNVTDGQTDNQTTCDRKTALCTKVHCAFALKKLFNPAQKLLLTAYGKLYEKSIDTKMTDLDLYLQVV